MARRRTRNRMTRRRGRPARGGGLGQIYSFGAPIVPGLGNSAEVVPSSSCLATARPGMIDGLQAKGLPGMSGGARRRRGGRRTRKQRGGRYSFDLSAPAAGGTPWGTGIPQVVRIPCEGSTPNPLNPGPHTPSTQPPIQRGGVGGVDSAYYYAPTAGYTNTPSTWVGSTGAPALLQTPYNAGSLNPACLRTAGGGRRRPRRATRRRRGSRKH
jgi:hypothetical protein